LDQVDHQGTQVHVEMMVSNLPLCLVRQTQLLQEVAALVHLLL
jgi:hypothetical protein